MPTVDSAKIAPKSMNLVYMGSYMPYKNVEALVRAMELLPEFTLTLCSKIEPKRKVQLISESTTAASSRIRFLNGASEEQYLKILDESFALVSASKDEGFGIPVVEAMSRSIPVVVADIPIFREVASTAGTFFNPTSPASFAAAVKNLQAMEAWQLASQNCLDRSEFFDWNKSADKLVEIIESITH
jgi:glycosyltransferase involved in cell wall biosynthesis